MTLHAVVTGAGTGIGKAVAQTLAAEGFRITLLGRRLPPLVAVSEALGDATIAISCDITDETQVTAAMNTARKQFGPISVLVNSAGTAPTAPFHKLDFATWKHTLATNLDGVFLCTRAVINDMRDAQFGRIINVASTASLKGYAYVSAYTSAKHGVLGLTRALALEVATHGITVNAVCPGYTDTAIIENAVANIVDKTGQTTAEALSHFTTANPQQRLIQPDEVAATVHWLCSDAARGVNGESISVSGGEI